MTDKQNRALAVAIIKVTPKLVSSTFNREAMQLLGNPRKVLFYNLGSGHNIVQPYTSRASMSTGLFDILQTKKAIIGGRVFSLSIRGNTAVYRTPSWIRRMGAAIANSPIEGYRVDSWPHTLYFNFVLPMETSTMNLKQIISSARKDGKTVLDAATSTFDSMFDEAPLKKAAEPESDDDGWDSGDGYPEEDPEDSYDDMGWDEGEPTEPAEARSMLR